MTVTVPDQIEGSPLTPEEVKLELACGLYGRGRIGRAAAAELAGVDFFTFQRALGERGIATTTEAMLEQDVTSLKALFPA